MYLHVHCTVGGDTWYMCTRCVLCGLLGYPKIHHTVSRDMKDLGYMCLVWTCLDIPRYPKVYCNVSRDTLDLGYNNSVWCGHVGISVL